MTLTITEIKKHINFFYELVDDTNDDAEFDEKWEHYLNNEKLSSQERDYLSIHILSPFTPPNLDKRKKPT